MPCRTTITNFSSTPLNSVPTPQKIQWEQQKQANKSFMKNSILFLQKKFNNDISSPNRLHKPPTSCLNLIKVWKKKIPCFKHWPVVAYISNSYLPNWPKTKKYLQTQSPKTGSVLCFIILSFFYCISCNLAGDMLRFNFKKTICVYKVSMPLTVKCLKMTQWCFSTSQLRVADGGVHNTFYPQINVTWQV